MSQIEVLEAQQDIVRDLPLFPSIDSSEQSILLFDLIVDYTAAPAADVVIPFAVDDGESEGA